jgi:hypothetical protein
MEKPVKEFIWSQFGASIDMLRNAINACPDKLWGDTVKRTQYWYLAYHTLFWLDFYLTDNPDSYVPYKQIGLTEHDTGGIYPQRVFTKEELISFLNHCREKCKRTISELTYEKANNSYKFGSLNLPFLELMLYNMRPAQHR